MPGDASFWGRLVLASSILFSQSYSGSFSTPYLAAAFVMAAADEQDVLAFLADLGDDDDTVDADEAEGATFPVAFGLRVW